MCSCDNRQEAVFEAAAENRGELEMVIRHYKETDSNIKQRSAQFLIENMLTHHTRKSEAVDSFRVKMLDNVNELTTAGLKQWWQDYKNIDHPQTYLDAHKVSAEFLIDNIESAVNTWEQSLWKAEVSEELFLNHVLPYRLLNETLPPIGWRDSLYNKYHHLVDTISDLKLAYTILYRAATTDVRVRHIGDMSYLLNPIDVGRIKRGRCLQQCIYVASVMRALGIPAVIDGITLWANYSFTGHSWVALVTADGTYTVYGDDPIAQKNNPINSSHFSIKYSVEKDYPISLDFRKSVAKIWRSTYAMNRPQYSDPNAKRETRRLFSSYNTKDVSSEYGLTHQYIVHVPKNVKCAYLCVFGTGNDWTPIDYAMAKRGKCSFNNIADSVVYLPMAYLEGELSPLDKPFCIIEGKKVDFNPDAKNTRSITLHRKYPFARSILRPWQETAGASIIASNDKDFFHPDTLFLIHKTPVFKNIIKTEKEKFYRYVKYASHPKRRGSITELQVFSKDSLLTGEMIVLGAMSPENAFDGNTFSEMTNLQPGYFIGLDLGKPSQIDSIIFYLRNDGNYIDIGDNYELLHYNEDHWSSLGRQNAEQEYLTFHNIPQNALLLLKNHTKGKEERIFTYENGEQVWW